MKERTYRPTVVVDFDGTICEHEFPGIGAPKTGVQAALKAIKKAGYAIRIHSCRTASYWEDDELQDQRYHMITFLLKNHIPFDDIVIDNKPIAMFYIDDRGIPFKDNWAEIAEEITNP